MKFSRFLLLFFIPLALWGAEPSKEPEVPQQFAWIKSLELEGGAYGWGEDLKGAQFFRVETRNIDPDPNAYVGMLVSFTRFNDKLYLGDPVDPMHGLALTNWGIAVGIVRGKSRWGVNLTGASIGGSVGFGPAFVGEHQLGSRWNLFHRTFIDFFSGDKVIDSDQGFLWHACKSIGITASYRIFAAHHTSRNGPSVGLRWTFQSPKLPFIFPSIG